MATEYSSCRMLVFFQSYVLLALYYATALQTNLGTDLKLDLQSNWVFKGHLLPLLLLLTTVSLSTMTSSCYERALQLALISKSS